MPPYLAGREREKQEFERLLKQDTILQNLVLTGLRGVGKTVLLETLKPIAIREGWLWVGTDLSESSSISEANMATRLLTDLSMVTSRVVLSTSQPNSAVGFSKKAPTESRSLSYDELLRLFSQTPGLVADKLKAVLELVATCVPALQKRGIIFAYDEAQNLADHAKAEQYPLSLLLDTFQSIQKRGIPFMLVLTGLPTLFPKLVEARTFSERMFRVVFVDRLSDAETREAIRKPLQNWALKFTDPAVEVIASTSGRYPYFIQFICRECYDVLLQKVDEGAKLSVPVADILRKLDSDFFAGRWARATDRQRELLTTIAHLENHDSEFTVQEVVEQSKSQSAKPFSSSHVNQMLASLSDAGLVYKNRHGKYSFAVPLLGDFILRQATET